MNTLHHAVSVKLLSKVGRVTKPCQAAWMCTIASNIKDTSSSIDCCHLLGRHILYTSQSLQSIASCAHHKVLLRPCSMPCKQCNQFAGVLNKVFNVVLCFLMLSFINERCRKILPFYKSLVEIVFGPFTSQSTYFSRPGRREKSPGEKSTFSAHFMLH